MSNATVTIVFIPKSYYRYYENKKNYKTYLLDQGEDKEQKSLLETIKERADRKGEPVDEFNLENISWEDIARFFEVEGEDIKQIDKKYKEMADQLQKINEEKDKPFYKKDSLRYQAYKLFVGQLKCTASVFVPCFGRLPIIEVKVPDEYLQSLTGMPIVLPGGVPEGEIEETIEEVPSTELGLDVRSSAKAVVQSAPDEKKTKPMIKSKPQEIRPFKKEERVESKQKSVLPSEEGQASPSWDDLFKFEKETPKGPEEENEY